MEQERLHRLVRRGYRQLANWQETAGAYAAGVVTAQQWVRLDRFDEMAQRQLMRLLAFDGRTSEAIAVYITCRELLQHELATDPDLDTVALYELIQQGRLELPVLALPHNLPRALRPLFGRKTEAAKLKTTLLDPAYPLVSIIGSGKTSLALAIGRQLLTTGQADVNPAIEPLRHALKLCQQLQYKSGEMQTLTWLGILAMRQENYTLCIQHYENALQLSRQLGDTAAEAELLGNLGVALRYQDDLLGSQTYHEAALTVFRQLNMPGREQWLLGELGLTAIRLGDYAQAEQKLSSALAIAQQIKDVFWAAWVKGRLGSLWNERGDAEKALGYVTEAFTVAEQLQNPRLQGMILLDWGLALLNQAEWVQAEQKLQQAYDLWQGLGQTQQAMPALAGLAYVSCKQKKPAVAAAHATQLWQIWQAQPMLAARADLKLYWMLGMVWHSLGDSRSTLLWQKASALLQKRCEKIPVGVARKLFLEQVPAHHAILALGHA